MNSRLKKSLCCIAICFFLTSVVVLPAFADAKKGHEASANDILTDLVYIRTTNFVSTILGTAWFLVTLPFTLPGENVGEAAEKFVENPGKLTFSRPLGDPDVKAVWPFKYDHPER